MTELQQATQFLFAHLGRRLMEIDSLPAYAHAQEGACAICGHQGAGVYDGRSNARLFRCLGCWSAFHPAPTVFVGKGKDQSFAGTTKTAWVLTQEDMTIYVSEDTLNGTDDRTGKDVQAAARAAIRYSTAKSSTIASDILNGHIKPPFLWGMFGQNKEASIRALRVTTGLSCVAFAEKGEAVLHDFGRVADLSGPVQNAIIVTREDKESRNGLLRWLYGGDLLTSGAIKDRLQTQRMLRAIGLPLFASQVPLSEREVLRRIHGDDLAVKPEKSGVKERELLAT